MTSSDRVLVALPTSVFDMPEGQIQDLRKKLATSFGVETHNVHFYANELPKFLVVQNDDPAKVAA